MLAAQGEIHDFIPLEIFFTQLTRLVKKNTYKQLSIVQHSKIIYIEVATKIIKPFQRINLCLDISSGCDFKSSDSEQSFGVI